MGTVQSIGRGVVLVVEDDQDLRAMIRELLESERYFVLEANDGMDALYTLRLGEAPTVDLIVLDLIMPRISGWDLIEMLRADPKLSRVPILVATGVPVHWDTTGIGSTLSWLCKPYREDALLAAVNGAIESTSASNRREGGYVDRSRDGKPSSSPP